MPGLRPIQSVGRPAGSRAGQTRALVLQFVLAEHDRSGLWPSRDVIAASVGIRPQTASEHRRKLIEEGRLDATAAAPDRPVRVHRLPFRLVLINNPSLTPKQARQAELDVAEFLTHSAPGCFAARVTKGAMEVPNLGITAGAYVVVNPDLRRTRGRYVLVRTGTGRAGSAQLALRQVGNEVNVAVEETLGIVVSVVRRVLP